MTDTRTPDLIPLIIRGRIITDNPIPFGTRRGEAAFVSPDVTQHLHSMVLEDPSAMGDLYALSLAEILDYLVQLGHHLHLGDNPYLRKALEMQLIASAKSASEEMTTGLFKALPRLLERERIEEHIHHNIGAKYLEGWVEEKMLDNRTCHIRAFGARTVHVIAGNASVIALQTIMDNAITRGDAIIKLPSNDPYFASAVAQTMIDMAPDHPLTRHLTVAYWKGGNEAVESVLYDASRIEKIVAWGGFDSMRSIRNYLAPGIDLVALDPKLSGSIIGPEAFESDERMEEAAGLAATDIGIFNQGGCVSARTLYVVTGTDKAGIEKANAFGRRVYERIQALPPHLSSESPAFDPNLREEIEGIRYSPAFKVIGGKRAEGAVIVSQDDELVDFSERLDCRTANIVPVDDVDAALRHITIHTQTIGIYPDSLKTRLRDQCALRGGQRIVSLGYAAAGNIAGPHDAIEPLRRMVRWIRDDTLADMRGVLFEG
jgi:hypothetical protein